MEGIAPISTNRYSPGMTRESQLELIMNPSFISAVVYCYATDLQYELP